MTEIVIKGKVVKQGRMLYVNIPKQLHEYFPYGTKVEVRRRKHEGKRDDPDGSQAG